MSRFINTAVFAILLMGCAQPKDLLFPTKAVPATPRQFTEGEVLYIRYCSGCHGWEGRGDGQIAVMFEFHPPPLAGTNLPENELVSIIKILHGDSPLILTGRGKIASVEADVSALMSYLKRLPQLDWEEVEKGRRAYESLCAFCHGVYGDGDGILASAQEWPPWNLSSKSFQLSLADDDLSRIISDGRGKMPGAREILDTDDIAAVISFVRVLSPGYELYERYCARCHGTDGYPPAETSDGIFGVPPVSRETLIGVVFDDDYFHSRPESFIRAWVEFMYKADHSSMPRFAGELDTDGVRKIVRYLRELDPRSGG